ncbi:MAG: tetratricopeptide repeat protein [Bacteroidetes bacterium]|nr:tetratricopeptide repeat protein [Bacteroidota bacterium]
MLSNALVIAQTELNKATDLLQLERDEIIYSAIKTVEELNRLYNTITDENLVPIQIEKAITEAITPGSPRQLFYSQDVIIDDDVNPKNASYFTIEKKRVKEYLQDLDYSYQKNVNQSVQIINLKTSKVKKTDYYFVRIYFEKIITGRHKTINEPYDDLKRVATIIAEKPGNHWKTYISNISFYRPSFPIDDSQYDLPQPALREPLRFNYSLYSDTSTQQPVFINAAYIDSITQAKIDSIRQLEEALEAEEIQASCEYFMSEGNAARNKEQWENALNHYYRVSAQECNRISTYNRIQEVQRMINLEASFSENTQTDYQLLGQQYRDQGDYAKAIDMYQQSVQGSLSALNIQYELASLKMVLETLDKISQDCGKDSRGCITLLSDEILKTPSEPHYYRARAAKYLERNQAERAITDLEKTIELRPKDVKARVMLADIFLKLSKQSKEETEKANLQKEALDLYNAIIPSVDSAEPYLLKRAYLYSLDPDNFNYALNDYQTILIYNQQSYETLMLRGKLYMATQDWIKAKLNFDQAAAIKPESAEPYYFRGICQIKRGYVSSADDFFTQARNLRMDRQQTDFLNDEAQKYFDLSQLEEGDEAIRLLTFAITINPEMHWAWAARGQVFHNQHRYKEAIRDYSQALIYDSNNADYMYLQGLAYQANMEFQAAINNYERAIDEERNAPYLLQLGDVHYVLGQYRESLEAYQEGLKLSPDNPFLLYKSGKAFLGMGDYISARNSFTNALSAKEAIKGTLRSAVYFYRGNANFQMGEYRQAMKNYQASEEDSHKPGRVYAAYGDIYFMYREFDKAEEIYLVALKKGYVDPQRITHQIGKIFMAREEYKEAIAQFKKCLYDPSELAFFSFGESKNNRGTEKYEAQIKRDLGLAYLYQGDKLIALKMLEEALKVNPQDGLAHYGKACLLASDSGSIQKIISHLEVALNSHQVNKYFIKQSPYFDSIKKLEDYKNLLKNY